MNEHRGVVINGKPADSDEDRPISKGDWFVLILNAIVIVFLCFVFCVQADKVHKLEYSLKIMQSSYNNIVAEKKIYKRQLVDATDTIERLEALLDENGIEHNLTSETYGEAMESIEFYKSVGPNDDPGTGPSAMPEKSVSNEQSNMRDNAHLPSTPVVKDTQKKQN